MLSILITAPLGAISIVFLGPRLLEKQDRSAAQGHHLQQEDQGSKAAKAVEEVKKVEAKVEAKVEEEGKAGGLPSYKNVVDTKETKDLP